MNRELIDRWNARVEPDDTVYHLGDFALGPSMRWPDFVKTLHGYKILIKGNHDGQKAKMRACGFNEVLDVGLHNGWQLIHDPLGMTGNVLCGHVHEKWKVTKKPGTTIINVGADQWDYTPRTFDELMGALNA